MLHFLLQKMQHKKWMVFSLLIGNILLIAIAISHPLYKQAVLDRMLSDEFTNYISENGSNPGIFYCNMTRNKDNISDFMTLKSKLMEDADVLAVPLLYQIEYLREQPTAAVYSVKRDNKNEVNAQISTITELTEHIELIAGEVYSDNTDGEFIEAIVSETAFVKLNLLIGDELTMKVVKDANGEKVKIKIVGVFTCGDPTDKYWVLSPSSFSTDLFVSREAFNKLHFDNNENSIILAKWYEVFDTDSMKSIEVDGLMDRTERLNLEAKELGAKIFDPEYKTVVDNYGDKINRVMGSIAVLQVPMIVLLCAFLFMISGQMLGMEQTEISLLKSRGASGRQIFSIYLLQSVILAVFSFAVALPLGMLLCRMLGSANAFLSFGSRKNLNITITDEVWIYSGVAVLVSILVQVIPALKHSRLTIVAAKQKKNSNVKKWWQVIYLDFIMLGVALYGYYIYNSRLNELALKVLEGEALDPLLYLSSSLFVLGAGLVVLRFLPLLIKLIFTIFRRVWSPEKYASFLQIIRTGHKQIFMMEFLILTVALGIFSATVARTILYNAEENSTYKLGTDLIVSEKWKSNFNQYIYGQASSLIYKEPDSTEFEKLSGVKSVTHVLMGEAASGTGAQYSSSGKKGSRTDVNSKIYFMGIITDEFGKMVKDNGGNPYSLKEYLNVLATDPSAVLVSENYKNNYGLKLGDKVEFTYQDSQASDWTKKFKGTIYGFFSEFPTYSPTTTTILENGTAVEVSNYMIVGNLGGMQEQMGLLPYSLWFELEGRGEQSVLEYLNDNNIQVTDYTSLDDELENIRFDPLFQGTNGILTLSFIVILILCSVGFLIYWILSIRERELLFGVFRAMGMSKKGILSMLVNEQMFSTIICLLVGTGIGFLASWLFVPIIQMTYTAGNQVLATPLVTYGSDMIKLFSVIGIVFICCMFILARIIFSMKITNALKLGED